ncbi:MAG: transposase [Bacteroidales bacterium]|jgi:putative transposase|nr:transposase [Bacteroidales bacterium]NCU40064.1 transposase [Candidatus Falkowbacteria bacterium]
MEKRKFTTEQKLAILKEASENGVNVTLEKYGIFSASFYQWKKKLDTMGAEGFTHGMTTAQLKRIRELEKENRLLKELIVEKELEGKLKDELLKKKFALEKKKNS